MHYDAGSVKLLHFHMQLLSSGARGRCYVINLFYSYYLLKVFHAKTLVELHTNASLCCPLHESTVWRELRQIFTSHLLGLLSACMGTLASFAQH